MTLIDQYGSPLQARAYDAAPVAPRIRNIRSGLGGLADKSSAIEFVDRLLGREEAERIYRMSWTAQRMIDIPVDDMFVRGREWDDTDATAADTMRDAEAALHWMDAVPCALKAARLFGGALLVICPRDGEFERPIDDAAALRPDSIANLLVVDRWSAWVEAWYADPSMPHYGRPYQYRVTLRPYGMDAPGGLPQAHDLLVSESRVFRFDGIQSPLTEGWFSGPWNREWGISLLTPAVDDILRDAATASGVGHLVEEAAVWIQKVQGYKQALMGRQQGPSVETLAQEASLLKSLYRVQFVDVEDELGREQVAFSGLADVMDRQAKRLAAIAGIPVTRFLGTSAVGLNATGEGDARDWRLTVASMQTRLLDPVMRKLDMLVARHAGLPGPPEYTWHSLGEETEQERQDNAKSLTELVVAAYNAGLVDEEEGRERLSGSDVWGELGPWTPPLADDIEAEREAERISSMPPRVMEEAA